VPDVAAALPRWQGKTLWARDRAAPLREFVRTEAASALMLVAGIVVAIIWANVSDASYESFWHTRFYLGVGSAGITQDLRTWLNSGLMTLFFLVVGLETRRELDLGDLRERRRFVLPIITGLLGMAFPVAIYLAFNAGRPGAHGWGVAMSTDTALALGLLALFGREVPDRMRVFVLIVFVVDDLGALLVIAFVYSDKLVFMPLVIAVAAYALMFVAVRFRLQRRSVFVVLGIVVWGALRASGERVACFGVGGLAAVDQLAEGAQRDREPGRGVPQRHQHGIGGCSGGGPGGVGRPALPQTALQRGDVGAGSVESRDLLLGRQGAVPDVVDPAREGVYRGQRPPLVAGQQRDAVGEVLGLLAGDPLALAVGSTDVTGHGLILVHEAHLPLAKALASSSTVRALPGRGVVASTS